MIYFSTGGYRSRTAAEICNYLINNDIFNIELSGGLYDENMLYNLMQFKNITCFQPHNYFPPPKTPFVFNLASLDENISKQSINHAIKTIQLSKDLNCAKYSFHAGFLLDPEVNELGKRISNRFINDRSEGIKRFLNNIYTISKKAEELNISLLIENNVLSAENYKEFSADPLLMTTPEESVYILENTPDNVNMLLDVAHLKVSSNTLGYAAVDMFQACDPWIKAYHFSDNDGLSDSNNTFDDNAWFWPFIKNDLDYYSIEVYNINIKEIKKLISLVKTKLNHKVAID